MYIYLLVSQLCMSFNEASFLAFFCWLQKSSSYTVCLNLCLVEQRCIGVIFFLILFFISDYKNLVSESF